MKRSRDQPDCLCAFLYVFASNFQDLKLDATSFYHSYPAGHVYIHDMLYELTNKGLNISKAQQVYAVLYLGTLALAYATYLTARPATSSHPSVRLIPNRIFLVLPLSKRLHSIYVLRLFNDCWEVAAANAAILALANGYYVVGTVALR